MNGDEILVLVLDQHAVAVEVKAPVFLFAQAHVLLFIRDVEKGLELHGQVNADMQPVQGILGVIGKGFVELLVLIVRNLALGFAPQRRLGIDLFVIDKDREGNEA